MNLPTLQRVDLTVREVDTKAWKRTVVPDPSHYKTVIDSPSMLYVNGVRAGVYMPLPEGELAEVRMACKRIEYQETYRTGGLKTTSRVFGYQPRIALRRDFCTSAALAREAPREHGGLTAGAALVSKYLRHIFPEEMAAQEKIVSDVTKPEWVLKDTHYTSGIVNWNNLLRYHFDSGNYPGTWNSMLTFKKDIEGGYLAVPQLDAAFAVRDGTLSVFNAQGFLHGVTPFKKLSSRAYRYTVVYYAMQGMCKCGTPLQELERIRAVKTSREQKRTGNQTGQEEDE